ncbi:MAG: ABC transporter ATP-binding protein [Actinobacteria bacterium]|nr:ABC transporter ATP-binding protein [Actinomycetota bacterium]
MAGFLAPTSGKVFYGSSNLYELSSVNIAKYRNREIGIVHQFFNLISDFNAIQNVMTPLLVSGKKRREAIEIAEMMLEKVGVLSRAKHYSSELSGGEQQRVAIARALVNKPKVVLADEPTGNLDNRNSQEIIDIFCDIHKQGNTIVLVTHDPMIAERADRSIDLSKYLCAV